jgi:anti-sigma B factor antagonist
MLVVEVEPLEGGTVCRVHGEIDAGTVTEFRSSLAALVEERRLVLDLSEVAFMDSAGLGAMIGAIRRTRENGGLVALACRRPVLHRLFRVTGLDRIVPLAEEPSAAMAAIADATPVA